MPLTVKVLPLTEPSRLVATSTMVSPTFTFMPRSSNCGTSISPRLSTGPSLLPLTMRPGSIGVVATSAWGSMPLMRMLVVSVKLLNMAPILTRVDQASTASSFFSACSTRSTAAGFMFRFSGSVSIEAT